MRPRHSALLPIMLIMAVSAAAGATSTGVTSLLRSYSVPNSLISSLVQVNLTYNGTTYAALYGSGQLYFVVDTSTNQFVISQGEIFSIIRNYTVESSFGSANFTQIRETMNYYMETASAPLTDCVDEVGLGNPGASCTLQNGCQSCTTVSYCNKVLNEVGGPDSPSGYGFINFDENYTNLESNLTLFYSAINSVDQGNINASLASINSSFDNIYKITTTIWQNPIFPPTDNITASEASECAGYGAATANFSLSGAPWFCNSIGFCPFLTVKDSIGQPVYSGEGFNFTVLNEIRAQIDAIGSLPLSNSQIESVAANANSVTIQYVLPQLSKAKAQELDTILNTSLISYNTTVYDSNSLLAHVSNSSLSGALAALRHNYSILTSEYLSINTTAQGSLVSNQLSRVSSLYSRINSSYSGLVSESNNNTGAIVLLQLDGNADNAYLSSLAFEELGLNTQISGTVSNSVALKAQLDSVKSGLSKVPSGEDPVVSISRSLGGASAEAISPSMGLPYSAAVALAPFTASIPAIIIFVVGIAGIAILYFMQKPKKQGTIAAHAKQAGLSTAFLAIGAAVLLVYLLVSLTLSFSDNGSAPISAFNSAIASSKTVAIALNGTQTSGMTSCYNLIDKKLTGMNKSIVTLDISGNKCTVSGTILTTDACLNSYASKAVPVIMLTNSTSGSISAYSLYGTMLQESGNSTELAECTAAQVI